MKARFYVILLLVFIVSALSVVSTPQELSNHKAAITIENANPLEQRLAVQAFEAVVNFYEQLGYSMPVDSRLRVLFQDPIHIKGKDILYAHAIYDPTTCAIRMIHFAAERFQNSMILGQKPCLGVYYSILVHESAHYMNSLICPEMDVIIDEAVACYIQLSLMENELRETFLYRIQGIEFRTYRQINMGAYVADPDNFVIACYRFCQAHPKIFMRFLNGRIAPVKDPLLMEW